jgi:hypothetical protein
MVWNPQTDYLPVRLAKHAALWIFPQWPFSIMWRFSGMVSVREVTSSNRLMIKDTVLTGRTSLQNTNIY